MAEYMRNALFGLAVGDALGVPHEKKPRGSFKCVGWDYTPEPDRKRMWSDDTALTLAELDSFGILKKAAGSKVYRMPVRHTYGVVEIKGSTVFFFQKTKRHNSHQSTVAVGHNVL